MKFPRLAAALKALWNSRSYRGTRLPLIPITVSITAGFVALFFLKIPGPGYLWALACLGAGSLLGIVFGIPRSASQPQERSQSSEPDLQANTNMEQISDWLTKLLVGAGLVELRELPQAIDSAAHYMAPALMSNPAAGAEQMTSIAAAILIYFSVEGFIGGYIFTRVYFVIVLHFAYLRAHPYEAKHTGAVTPEAELPE